MKAFSFASTKLLAVELGGASRLARMLLPHNARRPLVVTDRGVLTAGLLEGAMASMRGEGMDVCVYADTEADPPESLVLQCTDVAREHRADAIVGFGGGSSMDIAKLVAVLAEPSCSQPLGDMYGVGNVRSGARLPLVQVPTTAGTGSEVTPIAIITLGAEQKAGVVSPTLLPDVALLDGELTESLPGHVAAATGVDAMVHAIEAYTSAIRKNPLSDLLAREALSLLSANIYAVSGGGGGGRGGGGGGGGGGGRAASAEARSAMLLGSCYAGLAFANAPVAAVHALAYPLGARFHVPHGLSNSLMLPHVLRHNAEAEHAAVLYAELAPLILPKGVPVPNAAPLAARALVDHFTTLPAELGLPVTLGEVGVAAADVPTLAADAMKQTRLLPNNPREVSLEDATRLYHAAL